MRYDTPVYFQRITPGAYNAETGDYAPDTMTEDKVYASVENAGEDTLRLIYGGLKQGCLKIRLQNYYEKSFDRIRIGDGEKSRFYRVDWSRPLRIKMSFVVSEVQRNGESES